MLVSPLFKISNIFWEEYQVKHVTVATFVLYAHFKRLTGWCSGLVSWTMGNNQSVHQSKHWLHPICCFKFWFQRYKFNIIVSLFLSLSLPAKKQSLTREDSFMYPSVITRTSRTNKHIWNVSCFLCFFFKRWHILWHGRKLVFHGHRAMILGAQIC